MTLTELFQEYSDNLDKIHENRKQIKKKLETNMEYKKRIDQLRTAMYDIVMKKMDEGLTLYEICIKEFGSIDKRFHVLYTLVGKE